MVILICLKIDDEQGKTFSYSHRDALGRPFHGEARYEQYLKPKDRRLVELQVQCTYFNELAISNEWKRRAVRNESPYIVRLSEWALAREYVNGEAQQDTMKAALRWLPACLAILFVVSTCVKNTLSLQKSLTLLSKGACSYQYCSYVSQSWQI